MLPAPETTLDRIERFANQNLVPIGLKLIVALVVFIVGRWISKALLHGFERLTADPLVKRDRRRVPAEHDPLQLRAPPLDGPLRHRRQERLSEPALPVFFADE